MRTDCTRQIHLFQPQAGPRRSRKVEAAFDGGIVSSDAGGLLLREVEKSRGILARFSEAFEDMREEGMVEHTVLELVSQRVYGIALGYEDLNDHDILRNDPLLAVLVGKTDPTGDNRKRERDRGKALAGKSTLNRLELTRPDAKPTDRYKKISANAEAIDDSFIEIFLDAYEEAPERIVLDLDATDDRVHGGQEGRFFHGYYDCYCYLPLYIFCGEHVLCSRLRQSNIDASAGSVEELDRIVKKIRERWPETEICIRGDSGFCRDEIMTWCEGNDVRYILGMAKNSRLTEKIKAKLDEVSENFQQTGKPARVFDEFIYRTLKSWSRSRRVIAKAEHLSRGSNPRFVVTNYSQDDFETQELYEKEYCARGEMENRIKEQQLYLFADRTSTQYMYSNQLRLYFSSMAYVLMHELRRLALKGTAMAKAQCQTIRERLFKIGAQVTISVRRVRVSMASGCPFQDIFAAAMENLRSLSPAPS